MQKTNRVIGGMRTSALIVGLTATITLALDANAQSPKDIYDLQERCGRAAEQAFAKDNPTGKFYNSSDTFAITNFTSHYNTRLSRCLVRYDTTFTPKKDHKTKKNFVIFDPNENKEYAHYWDTYYDQNKIVIMGSVASLCCRTGGVETEAWQDSDKPPGSGRISPSKAGNSPPR